MQREPIKLGVMISGGGTTLQNLQEKILAGELHAQVACVISSSSKVAGVERAKKLGLPIFVVDRKSFVSVEAFSEAIATILRQHHIELTVMAGFLCLWRIPADLAGRVMNIHPALLPKFGGKGMHGHFVHEAVLAAGEKESGCTVHFADNSYDTGPMILQRRCAVLAGDKADTLAARVFEQECIAYPAAISWWAEGALAYENNRVFIRKVLAYITREKNGRRELLVFEHVHCPEAGVQVPHGTVERGETPAAAVLREVSEETGLKQLAVAAKIGVFEWRNPTWGVLYERHVFHFIAPPNTPDGWEWYETSGGKREREPEFLFRFRWAPLDAQIELAGGQGGYLNKLVHE